MIDMNEFRFKVLIVKNHRKVGDIYFLSNADSLSEAQSDLFSQFKEFETLVKPANPDVRFVVCTLCERVIRVVNLNEELL